MPRPVVVTHSRATRTSRRRADLPQRLLARLSAAHMDVRNVTSLTRAGGGRVFKLDLAGGRSLVLRIFKTRRAARQVFDLLRSAGSLLPKVRGLFGHALVVDFIDGTPLDRVVTVRDRTHAIETAHVAAVGRILARIHRVPVSSAGALAVDEYGRLLARFTRDLVRRGLLDRLRGRRLLQLRPPSSAHMALTHGDLSPDNLVLTPGGRIRVIDIERLAVRPVAFDLARTIVRWNLDEAGEGRLLRAYRRAGGDPDTFLSAREFWSACAWVGSAAYRVNHGLPGVAGRLSRVRSLVDGLSTPTPRL